MPNNEQTEVLVVGAGPVGLLTVLLLKQHGVRARIIDMESRTASHSYACALHPATLGLLERVGLADEVVELGRRIKSVSLYEGEGRVPRAHFNLSDLPGRYPFAVVIEQSVLEDLLEQQLRRTASKVEWNHRLVEIKASEDGVDARIENLAGSGRADNPAETETSLQDRVTIHADFVIGADGHHSALRQLLNIPLVKVGVPQLFAIYEIETAEPVDHVMKLVLGKTAHSVLWPLAKNRCRWSIQVTPSTDGIEFPAKDRHRLMSVRARRELDRIEVLRDLLAKRAPWFHVETITEMNWVAHVQFERQMALRFGQGRCWLAGDAAHQTSPGGMQSMNLGLLEGADLADRLKSVLRDKAETEVLQDYGRIHGGQWRRLLGLKDPTGPARSLSSWASRHFRTILGIKEDAELHPPLPSWASRHFGTIMGSLPASGDDLNHLLKQF